jgi:hypothetical protein
VTLRIAEIAGDFSLRNFSATPAVPAIEIGGRAANHGSPSTSKEQDRMQRWIMAPKYNQLMDNVAFRVSLNVGIFALWLVAAFALLKLA